MFISLLFIGKRSCFKIRKGNGKINNVGKKNVPCMCSSNNKPEPWPAKIYISEIESVAGKPNKLENKHL